MFTIWDLWFEELLSAWDFGIELSFKLLLKGVI